MLSWLLIGLLMLASLSAQGSVGEFLFENNRRMEAWRSGLEERSTVIDGVRWHYYARITDQQACTVLIHGFTAEASHWFRFSRLLDKRRCLIIPDLPGFGQSEYRRSLSFRIPEQQIRLQRFLAKVRPRGKFDLVGSSMGGHIVLQYALANPTTIRTVTLFNGGGIKSPLQSDASRYYERTGRAIFEVRTKKDFERIMRMSMQDPPWMPSVVSEYLAGEFMERRQRYVDIFKQIYFQDLLEHRLSGFAVPLMIIWGREDRLLDVSMAYQMQRLVRDAGLHVVKNAGHLPFLEDPDRSAEIYEAFVDGVVARSGE